MPNANETTAVILGSQWKNETAEVKNHFRELADTIKQQHKENHPDYRYQPCKPSEKKRRASRRKNTITADNLAPPNATSNSPLASASLQGPAEDVLPIAQLPEISTHAFNLAIASENQPAAPAVTITAHDPDGTAGTHPAHLAGWTDEGNGILSTEVHLDADDHLLHETLLQYNTNCGMNATDEYDPELFLAPVGMRPTAAAKYDEDFMYSLIDWTQIEKESDELERAVAEGLQLQY